VSIDDAQLELIELRRRFGNKIALDGLSFTVPRGQVLGFLAGTSYSRAILRTGSRLKVGQVLQIGCLSALVDIELWQERRNPGKSPPARRRGILTS